MLIITRTPLPVITHSTPNQFLNTHQILTKYSKNNNPSKKPTTSNQQK